MATHLTSAYDGRRMTYWNEPMSTPANVAVEATHKYGLGHWEGLCLELVDHLLHIYPEGETLWVEPTRGPWTYHAVLVLNGVVHDAWHPEIMLPPAEYVARVFGAGTPWEMNPGDPRDAAKRAHS